MPSNDNDIYKRKDNQFSRAQKAHKAKKSFERLKSSGNPKAEAWLSAKSKVLKSKSTPRIGRNNPK